MEDPSDANSSVVSEGGGQVRHGREIRGSATNNSSATNSPLAQTSIGLSSPAQLYFQPPHQSNSLSPLNINQSSVMQEMETEYPSPFGATPASGWVNQSTHSFQHTTLSPTPTTPRLRTIPLPPLNTTAVLTEVLRCGVMSRIGLAAVILSPYPIEHLTTYAWWQAAATSPGLDRMSINIPLLDEEIVVCGSGLCGTVCVGDVILGIRQCWHRRRRPSYQPGWGTGRGPLIWRHKLSNSPQSPGSAFLPRRDHEWLGLAFRINQHAWDLVLVDNGNAW